MTLRTRETQASMPIRHGGILASRTSTWPRDTDIDADTLCVAGVLLSGAPGQLIAGGAGARPDHPKTDLRRRHEFVTDGAIYAAALTTFRDHRPDLSARADPRIISFTSRRQRMSWSSFPHLPIPIFLVVPDLSRGDGVPHYRERRLSTGALNGRRSGRGSDQRSAGRLSGAVGAGCDQSSRRPCGFLIVSLWVVRTFRTICGSV